MKILLCKICYVEKKLFMCAHIHFVPWYIKQAFHYSQINYRLYKYITSMKAGFAARVVENEKGEG